MTKPLFPDVPHHQCSAANSSVNTSQLSNIDSNEDKDMDKEKGDNGNKGDESNKSESEDA